MPQIGASTCCLASILCFSMLLGHFLSREAICLMAFGGCEGICGGGSCLALGNEDHWGNSLVILVMKIFKEEAK